MTLPSSGTLQASDINVELGRAWNNFFDMNGAAERKLAGKLSGAISFWDFYGKSNSVREPANGEIYEYVIGGSEQYAWVTSGNNSRLGIYWGGGLVHNSYPANYNSIVSLQVGNWTYYRGSLMLTQAAINRYALFRVGRY